MIDEFSITKVQDDETNSSAAGNAKANELLSRKYRSGWTLNG